MTMMISNWIRECIDMDTDINTDTDGCQQEEAKLILHDENG